MTAQPHTTSPPGRCSCLMATTEAVVLQYRAARSEPAQPAPAIAPCRSAAARGGLCRSWRHSSFDNSMRASLDTIQAARTPTVHDRAVDAGPIGAVCTSRFGTKCHCIGESYAFLRHVVRYLAQDGVGAASEVDLGWHGSAALSPKLPHRRSRSVTREWVILRRHTL